MRYFYIAIFCSTIFSSIAQTTQVNFRVDMNAVPISVNGVHLAGSFQNWDASSTEMTDVNFDGVYEVVLNLDSDSIYEYKFINGNEWGNGNDESLFGLDCGTTDGNRSGTDRPNPTFESCHLYQGPGPDPRPFRQNERSPAQGFYQAEVFIQCS